ncbi:MAG: glycoside hydrolase family 3 N-terminal domain-containing protein [Brachybacterium sp.]|nr:glycoside hydrolase family 3 N-terminal domain-containing protein [Brachybacterium sp.]
MRRRAALASLAAAPLAGFLAGCGGEKGDAPDGADSGEATPAPEPAEDDPTEDGATTEEPPPDPLAERVAALTDRQAAGQLVLVGIHDSDEVPAGLITDHAVGGFFLLGRWESAEAVSPMVTALRESDPEATDGIGPLVAVDQEGGQVRVLRGDAMDDTPSAETLGEDGPDAVRDAYRLIGAGLADLGIGMDLAPVADVVDPDLGRANAPVGQLRRGFGTEPEHVGECVAAAVEGLAEHDVLASLKHFPGLGRVRENTDHSADGITDEATAADDAFLGAFTAGIDAGAASVMLSSAVYTRIDAENPAMFSYAVVTDLLRGQLGFDQLVLTDDIGVAAAVQDVPVGERATRTLAAGGDAVLTADPSLTPELIEAIEAWAAESEENAARVRESATRMLRAKETLGLLG